MGHRCQPQLKNAHFTVKQGRHVFTVLLILLRNYGFVYDVAIQGGGGGGDLRSG